MTDARSTLVGLIGWPVAHSVSPAMHNAAFAALGMEGRYVPLAVAPEPQERIGEAVRGLRALGFRGANVTVPHKQAVVPHLDRLTPAAEAIGAVNTILVEPDGALAGDNTDAAGFAADLDAHGVAVGAAEALVIGAGGSARAVVYALAQAGAAAVTVLNRTVERAEHLAGALAPRAPGCRIETGRFPADLAGAAAGARLIVNCTSLGMSPHSDGLPWEPGTRFRPGQVVYDLVYNPPQTRLLALAQAQGARPIGGLGMLVWQGALAFARWTGQEPPVDAMRAAAEDRFGVQTDAPA